jgi:hypothetical protein
MWFDQGYGYHVDNTTGIATGNDPESIYAVMSGTHFNQGCCFVRSHCTLSHAARTKHDSRRVVSTAPCRLHAWLSYCCLCTEPSLQLLSGLHACQYCNVTGDVNVNVRTYNIQDYGNSETDDKNDGCATMEAIYFGNASWHGNRGAGKGPWLGADLEQGMCKPSLCLCLCLCRSAPLRSAARAQRFSRQRAMISLLSMSASCLAQTLGAANRPRLTL